MIFSSRIRTDDSPKKNNESDYQFLDRAGRTAFESVRNLIESYLANYPASERVELMERIKSRRPDGFASAIFELFLHQALLSCGFELEPHPHLHHTKFRPDFLVKCPQGYFYLEAVLATERGDVDAGAQLRIQGAIEAITAVPHRNFFVFVDYRGVPTTQPSVSKLRPMLLKWLDSLDPDEVTARNHASGFHNRPSIKWRHEDWEITISAIAIDAEHRGKPTRLLGGFSGGGGWRDGWSPIRDAVLSKSRKYGKLDHPLVIAVNYDSVFLNQIDEVQALFGQEQFSFAVNAPPEAPKLTRALNGAWQRPQGPKEHHASGMWSFKGLTPYNAATCEQALYVNPWADKQIPDCMLCFPHSKVVEQHLLFKSGISIGEVLGLKAGWLD